MGSKDNEAKELRDASESEYEDERGLDTGLMELSDSESDASGLLEFENDEPLDPSTGIP